MSFDFGGGRWDDWIFFSAARQQSTNAAQLENMRATGIENYAFEPATVGAGANKWLMVTGQATHRWNKGNLQFHIHFTPAADIAIPAGQNLVITWTFLSMTVPPADGASFTDVAPFTLVKTVSGGAGGVTFSKDKNYNAETSPADRTFTSPSPSHMCHGRLELTSVVLDGVDQSTKMFVNGFDAHLQLSRGGTINAWPEP